jgi:bacterioferritin-associated ferredoxin
MLSSPPLFFLAAMYICICNAITERQIVNAVALGARSTRDLARELGVGLGCGRCMSCAKTLLTESVANVTNPPSRVCTTS